jgi:hypothetical protein
MLSSRTVPTTPFADENGVEMNTSKAEAKTPAANKARRAFGDISNRKVSNALKSAADKSIVRSAAVEIVPSKSVLVTTAPKLLDTTDDEIELPAGRLGFQEDKLHEDSFYECDIPNDVRFAREDLDAVIEEIHTLNLAADDEHERQLLEGLDEDIVNVFKKVDGT